MATKRFPGPRPRCGAWDGVSCSRRDTGVGADPGAFLPAVARVPARRDAVCHRLSAAVSDGASPDETSARGAHDPTLQTQGI